MTPDQISCPGCQTTPGWHAGLHVGHVWTAVGCPAYRTGNGEDCTCTRNIFRTDYTRPGVDPYWTTERNAR